jgi:hypothetical protein
MSFVHVPLRRTRMLVAVFVLAAFTGAAAACGSLHSSSATRATPRSPSAAWHQVVVCARTHGMPNLPDPQINANGKAIFPSGLNIPERTRQACQSLYDRLVPSAQNQAPTSSQLAALLRFARCMRSHGIADWPDPRPDGSFVPDARISRALKSMFRGQLMACERFNPDPHGRVYFGHP